MNSVLILLLAVPLFFAPKINLFSFAGQTAGIRIDDLVLAVVFVQIFYEKITKQIKSNSIELYVFIIFLLMVFSNIFNILFFENSTLLYSLRIVEYFTFFYVGQRAVDRLEIRKITLILLYLNLVIMILQQQKIIGGFASAGYVDELDRVIGITGGPWEIGTLLNFFFCALVFDKKNKKFEVFYFFSVTLFMILLTQARQPLAVHLMLLMMYIASRYRSTRLKITAAATFIFVSVGLVIFYPSNPIIERSAGLFTKENLSLIADQFGSEKIDVSSFEGFDEIDNTNTEIDLSWTYRLYKWAIIVLAFLGHPEIWLFGFGPGMWGTAVDGGWLRILSETGIVGLLMFLKLHGRLASLNRPMKYLIFSYFLNLIMIDVEIAYKIQQYLFFAAGYFFQRNKNEKASATIANAVSVKI